MRCPTHPVTDASLGVAVRPVSPLLAPGAKGAADISVHPIVEAHAAKRLTMMANCSPNRRTAQGQRPICLLAAAVLALLLACQAGKGFAAQAHYDLRVRLIPAQNRLRARARIEVRGLQGREISFFLSPHATVESVALDSIPRRYRFEAGRLVVPLGVQDADHPFTIAIGYSGKFDDPAPIQPINTDNPGYGVSATITPRGSFLLAGAGWYPVGDFHRTTFSLAVTAPAPVVAVTSGRCLGVSTTGGTTTSRWQIDYPLQGLSLSAAAYIVTERKLGRITAATYLLAPEQDLADRYLDAIARYIPFFAGLFGPYPFDKFAVVENFFPTGYGFASYTLMGGTVLRLPFIAHTSLPHEIAHCWWGNSVYVDTRQGNWVEGLTTYVSDYLLKERTSPAAARDYRRQWLRNYATLVSAGKDFPLRRFTARRDPVTQTIGYDKAAMVFHMLRRRIGDDVFWQGLRVLYAQKKFSAVSWKDLQTLFESESHTDLTGFFGQWIDGTGAVRPALESVERRRSAGGWRVSGRLIQQPPVFDALMPVSVTTAHEVRAEDTIHLRGPAARFDLQTRSEPSRLSVDPNYDVFRLLHPEELPASVNSLRGSPQVTVLTEPQAAAGFGEAAQALVSALGLQNVRWRSSSPQPAPGSAGCSMIFVGRVPPPWLARSMPDTIRMQRRRFALQDQLFTEPSDALFAVVPQTGAAGCVVGLFRPPEGAAALTVARKIAHYGNYSYLAFHGEDNRLKGVWPAERSPLIFTWKSPTARKTEGEQAK